MFLVITPISPITPIRSHKVPLVAGLPHFGERIRNGSRQHPGAVAI